MPIVFTFSDKDTFDKDLQPAKALDSMIISLFFVLPRQILTCSRFVQFENAELPILVKFDPMMSDFRSAHSAKRNSSIS